MSSEELFDSLSNGREYVTMSDLKKWDYLNVLLDGGIVAKDTLKSLFTTSGAAMGRLNNDQFELFIEKLMDKLDLEDENDDNYSEEEEEEEEEEGEDEDEDDDENDDEIAAKDEILINDFEDTEDLEELNLAVGADLEKELEQSLGLRAMAATVKARSFIAEQFVNRVNPPEENNENGLLTDLVTNDLVVPNHVKATQEGRSVGKDILANVFKKLLPKQKSTLTYSDVLKWDLVKALVDSEAIDEEDVQGLFDSCCSPKKKDLTLERFEEFAVKLNTLQIQNGMVLSTHIIMLTLSINVEYILLNEQ